MSDDLGELLKKFVEETIMDIEFRKGLEDDNVRFTISLDSLENQRLEYISKKVEMHKTTFVREATMLLIYAFEQRFGLDLGNPEYFKALRSGGKKKDTSKGKAKSKSEE